MAVINVATERGSGCIVLMPSYRALPFWADVLTALGIPSLAHIFCLPPLEKSSAQRALLVFITTITHNHGNGNKHIDLAGQDPTHDSESGH